MPAILYKQNKTMFQNLPDETAINESDKVTLIDKTRQRRFYHRSSRCPVETL